MWLHEVGRHPHPMGRRAAVRLRRLCPDLPGRLAARVATGLRRLDGGWTFTALGEAGSKVELEIEFELASRALDLLFGGLFEETCNRLVEAFTQRADQIYGKGGAR